MFPRLFLISNQKHCSVSEMGVWGIRGWEWRFSWRRNLHLWEQQLVQDIHNSVRMLGPVIDAQDKWICKFDSSGSYTSKAAYTLISSKMATGPIRNEQHFEAFGLLWKGHVPSKCLVISWQVFLGRIASKENLIKRNLTFAPSLPNCVICNQQPETMAHLFANCTTVANIWDSVSL